MPRRYTCASILDAQHTESDGDGGLHDSGVQSTALMTDAVSTK